MVAAHFHVVCAYAMEWTAVPREECAIYRHSKRLFLVTVDI